MQQTEQNSRHLGNTTCILTLPVTKEALPAT